MRRIITGFSVCFFSLATLSGEALAQASAITNEAQLDAFLPKRITLDQLLSRIEADPDNLDHYYAYAKAAEKEGQYTEAAWAYRHMLEKDASLDRVRLDLSLAYIRLGHFIDAKGLLQEVEAHNPPVQVKQNVESVLAQIEPLARSHVFSGTFSLGMNYDSNANAAPSSGNITLLDTTIPLGTGAGRQDDIHGFAALTLAHTYQPVRIWDSVAMRWKSSALAYGTEQRELDNLNIRLYGLRTGPEFIYTPAGFRMELAAGYNYLTLDGHAYLRNPRAEALAELAVDPQVTLLAGHVREFREFLNAPTVTVYDDRTGNAWQYQFGLRYLYSSASVWEGLFIARHEDARLHYYANRQSGFSLAHTYMFEGGYFSQERFGFKLSGYEEADTLISSLVRSDEEQSVQFIFGKRFEESNLSASVSYMYTNVQSNIQNYGYDNHRVGLVLTKGF